ncbi:MAG: glycerophosphodiester phosphodiesterase [Promethearchaeota archaeon]|nr:MAG: glycerophosphodiester phosphodiesterase [Candidatus Lokiarchaeota archaeon]
MNKPYIFAHRGASAYCIENTMHSFQMAIEMKVGIESDIQITKDKILVCFHDPAFKIENKWYIIRKLTFDELKLLNFEDDRQIPKLRKVFDTFNYCPKNLRYSFDIINKQAGLELINSIKKYSTFKQVEITDTRIYVLKRLRKYNRKVKLVYTVPHNIFQINNKTIYFDKLEETNINAINLKIDYINMEIFRNIVKNGFKCYVWGVNSQAEMIKALKLRADREFIRAIYTDYPDLLKKKRDEIFK